MTWPFALLYLLGLTLVAGAYLVRYLRTCRLVRSSRPVSDPEVLAIWRRVSRRSPLRGRVALCTSPRLSSPACCGWRRPVLLVPAGPVADSASLEWALRHELVHLERGDAGVAGLQALLTTIAWFHPMAWWFSRQIDRLRELSCDLLVVLRTGKRRSYALALLSYAGEAVPERPPMLGPNLLQWSRSPSQLRRRIEMLAEPQAPPSRRRRWTRITTIGAFFAGAWAAQLAIAATLIPPSNPTAGAHPVETAEAAPAAPTPAAPVSPARGTEAGSVARTPRSGSFARASELVLAFGDDAPAGVLPFEELGEAWSDLEEPIQLANFAGLKIDEEEALRPVDVLERLPWLVHLQTEDGILEVSVQSGQLVVTVDGEPVPSDRIQMKPNQISVRLEDGTVADAPLPIVGLPAVTDLDGVLRSLELDRARLSKLQRDAWRSVQDRLRDARRRAQRQHMELERFRISLERRWNERQAQLRIEERQLQNEWKRQQRELERLKHELRRQQRSGGESAADEERLQRFEEEMEALEEVWGRFDEQWAERADEWRDRLSDVRELRHGWIESFESFGESFERDLEASFEALDQDFETLRDSLREQLEQNEGPWSPAFRQSWEAAFEQIMPPFDQICDEILEDFEGYRDSLDEDVADYDEWMDVYRDERSRDLTELIGSWRRTLALHIPELRERSQRDRGESGEQRAESEVVERIEERETEGLEEALDELIEELEEENEVRKEIEEREEERDTEQEISRIDRGRRPTPMARAAQRELQGRAARSREAARRVAADRRSSKRD